MTSIATRNDSFISEWQQKPPLTRNASMTSDTSQSENTLVRTNSSSTYSSLYSTPSPRVLQLRKELASPSSENVVVTTLDTSNPLRICKPGAIPKFPLIDMDLRSEDTMYKDANYLIKAITNMLDSRGIEHESVSARMRYNRDDTPKESDQTILIVAPKRRDSAWRMFVFDVIESTSLCELGLRWRIEFIDPSAIAGKTNCC
jgi:hypothetical protein